MKKILQAAVEVCAIDDCGKPARKAGLCWGHHRQKREDPGGFRALNPKYANGSQDLSSTDRLALAAREYADADVTDEKAYFLALRNLCAAAKLRALRPVTRLRLPGFVARKVVGPGLVQLTFKERRKR